MPRSFDVWAEAPASVEQGHAAFGREDYWLARFAASDAASTLDSLIVDADGTVRVAITTDLLHNLLPGIVAKLYRRDLKLVHTETWRPAGDGQLRGEISIAACGAPGSGHGAALLEPAQHGSRLTVNASVEFKVPLVGGTIESFLAREFTQAIPVMHRFTSEWIDEHA
jgi:hypothetical protein